MELPKILWLKNHMEPSRFRNCQFFDLPDYLTYRATGNNARSACSLTCKCGFLPERDSSPGSPLRTTDATQQGDIDEEHPKDGGWSPSLLRKVGLTECVENGYKQLGGRAAKAFKCDMKATLGDITSQPEPRATGTHYLIRCRSAS